MADLSALDLAIIASYMLLMLGLGAVIARRGGSFTEFFLAGRAFGMLELQLFGRHWVLIQKYIMFKSVPLSLLGFFAGLLVDARRRRSAAGS